MQLKKFLGDTFSVGKGAVKLPIDSMISKYRAKYNALRSKYSTFKFTVWYVQPGGRTIVHIKVPSTTVDNFFYDVLLELDRSGGASRFEDCHVKFFSNCPSFVYTYANVLYNLPDPDTKSNSMIIDKFNQKIPKDRLLVKGAEKKLGEEPVTEKPVVRNPMNLPFLDGSIYYAIFYLLDMLDFRKVMYNKHVTSMSRLLATVDDFDTLMAKRAAQERKQRDQTRETKRITEKTFRAKERSLNATNVRKTKAIAASKNQHTSKMRSTKSTSPVSRKK